MSLILQVEANIIRAHDVMKYVGYEANICLKFYEYKYRVLNYGDHLCML